MWNFIGTLFKNCTKEPVMMSLGAYPLIHFFSILLYTL